MGEQKEGSVVTENPKGGPLKFACKMKTWERDRESHQKLFGGGGGNHFSEVAFKGWIG